ncbi:MAG: VWA domain-containing protein [Kofleriaceae bacterium]
MMGWHFAEAGRVHLVWVALAVVALLAVLEVRSRDALARFLSPVMQRRLAAQASGARVATRLALVLGALLFGVLGLMRPQARGVTETVIAGRATADIVFVLDVSKSMLADDTAPNRLARAKAEIAQVAERLARHRVGLVVFAGRAVPVCPLTPDHSFFNMVLGGVDPGSVSTGGTRIGEAVSVAVRSFPAGEGAKLIVLITDGEDHESYPLEAAKAAAAVGAKIVAIGLGSEEGTPLVVADPQTGVRTPITYDGQAVISRLDADTLRQMASATEGAYVPAGTSALDLDAIVDTHVQPMVRAGADASVRTIPAERYPWMVLGALVCLLASLWIGSDAARRSP